MLHGRVPRFPVFFASILRERSLCFAVLVTGIVLVAANLLHLRLWVCLFRETTGLPCPGCGMTRAMSALCRGHLHDSLALHPFAPGIALAAVLLLLATVLPVKPRTMLVEAIALIEQRTGLALLFSIAMLTWGVWRIFHLAHAS